MSEMDETKTVSFAEGGVSPLRRLVRNGPINISFDHDKQEVHVECMRERSIVPLRTTDGPIEYIEFDAAVNLGCLFLLERLK